MHVTGSVLLPFLDTERKYLLFYTTKCSNFKIGVLYDGCFENGGTRDERVGDWRKLHNEELRNLYYSPNIITMINSRRMRWAGHVERMGRRRMHRGF
jgi:hypothetical protein